MDPEAARDRLLAELLDGLASEVDGCEVRQRLDALADDPQTRAWIKSFDPAMVELARTLIRRWGRRGVPPPP